MDKEIKVLNCIDWIFIGGVSIKRIIFYIFEINSF